MMCPAILAESAKGNRIDFYLTETSWTDVSVNATGAFVAAGGSFFRMPGRKKLAGETDAPVLIPEQPAASSATATGTANQKNFPFNLTCPL
jgi:hypothetical protein